LDRHAEDVVVEFVITVPVHPRRIGGRDIGVVAALAKIRSRLEGYDEVIGSVSAVDQE
jgi:hypothetical protein